MKRTDDAWVVRDRHGDYTFTQTFQVVGVAYYRKLTGEGWWLDFGWVVEVVDTISPSWVWTMRLDALRGPGVELAEVLMAEAMKVKAQEGRRLPRPRRPRRRRIRR